MPGAAAKDVTVGVGDHDYKADYELRTFASPRRAQSAAKITYLECLSNGVKPGNIIVQQQVSEGVKGHLLLIPHQKLEVLGAHVFVKRRQPPLSGVPFTQFDNKNEINTTKQAIVALRPTPATASKTERLLSNGHFNTSLRHVYCVTHTRMLATEIACLDGHAVRTSTRWSTQPRDGKGRSAHLQVVDSNLAVSACVEELERSPQLLIVYRERRLTVVPFTTRTE